MNVLLVGPLPPPPLVGGVETGVKYLLESSLAQSVNMRLFNTARLENPNRAIHRKLGYQLGAFSRFFVNLFQIRADVVHVKTASGVNFFQNIGYCIIARCLGRKVLLQIHGGAFNEFYEKSGAARQALIRGALRVPHRIAALSQTWAEYIANICTQTKITVLPNALQVEAYAKALEDRARIGISNDRVAILFMGGRDEADLERKGLPQLAWAVAKVRKRCPKLLLVLAGPVCNEEMLTKILGPQHEAWTAVGAVTGHSKLILYKSVDIFALPSRAENMPNTIMEAMAAGLPIIASTVGAIPEMVEHGKNGFVLDCDAKDILADKISLLAYDRNLRLAMGAESQKRAMQNYNYALLETRLSSEYRSLLSGHTSVSTRST
jgi:glycosyltransferase involved in cell wall biosynthesis